MPSSRRHGLLLSVLASTALLALTAGCSSPPEEPSAGAEGEAKSVGPFTPPGATEPGQGPFSPPAGPVEPGGEEPPECVATGDSCTDCFAESCCAESNDCSADAVCMTAGLCAAICVTVDDMPLDLCFEKCKPEQASPTFEAYAQCGSSCTDSCI